MKSEEVKQEQSGTIRTEILPAFRSYSNSYIYVYNRDKVVAKIDIYCGRGLTYRYQSYDFFRLSRAEFLVKEEDITFSFHPEAFCFEEDLTTRAYFSVLSNRKEVEKIEISLKGAGLLNIEKVIK